MEKDFSTPFGPCKEAQRLLDAYCEAVEQFTIFQEQHFIAILNDESDAQMLELLSNLASNKCQQEKSAYLNHIEEHRCGMVREVNPRASGRTGSAGAG